MTERDETPTLVRVISGNRPWATVLVDGQPDEQSRRIDGEPRRPLNYREQVHIPRYQAQDLERKDAVVIIGR